MIALTLPILRQLASTLTLAFSILFLVKLYKARSHARRLQKQGLPMPPHNWLLGHIPLAFSFTKNFPPNTHGIYTAEAIRKRYPHLKGAMYLDFWPMEELILLIYDPDMMYQLNQAHQSEKHPSLRVFLRPLTGEEDLVTLEGAPWKRWRNIFNPGFSASHVSTLVPTIVEETMIFRTKLMENAKDGAVFRLDSLALNLTIDIIGRVVMDHRFESQLKNNDLVAALRSQVNWATTGFNINPLEYFNLLRPLVHIYNTRIMNKYLTRELDNRYDTTQKVKSAQSKTIVDLALKAFLEENPDSRGMTKAFKAFTISQIKLFIFAGHDTTSTATVFVWHTLSQHPEILAKVRTEHDDILGTDPSAAASIISANPHVLNQLSYTAAVIKESMRQNPAVSALRAGKPDLYLTGENDQQFPTGYCMIWGDHYGVHHNPNFWVSADKFIPERWLVPTDDPLYPPSNGYRPFERGPRNCIGQNLAITEMKVILALVLRDFDLQEAYQRYNADHGIQQDWKINGSRVYLKNIGGSVVNYPCTVALATPP